MVKRKKMIVLLSALSLCMTTTLKSQVQVNVDFLQKGKPYSKYLFGKNNSMSDKPEQPLTTADWTRIKDAGITMFRENGGNNSSKYNWRKKLSSHPDWYNNVHTHDWDFEAQAFLDNVQNTEIQMMYGFQLLGKAAKTGESNFDAWGYNQAKWWDGVHQNLAGGGTVNPDGGGKALVDGDPTLYLEDWPADSTAKILDHWFGTNGLGYDKERFQYWCMDNEPGIWSGTHNDVVSNDQTMEEYMQNYFAVAKKVREKYPNIKLVGPILANEWQWYHWHNKKINYQGTKYTPMEYFIKRVAEEQEASGVRLLDVFSLHFYPGSKKIEQVVQYHRVFFDETYVFPEANGVKTVNGGWDDSINKEYIFKRVNDWLTQHLGANHGVTLGMTETGININDADAISVWYASTIGEFMKNGVELFTPWSWKEPMWEVLHLFSNYSYPKYHSATSSNEEMVSCHVTYDETNKKVTCFVINRDHQKKHTVNINLNGVTVDSGTVKALELDDLSIEKTFYSAENNALKEKVVTQNAASLSIEANALSVVAISFNYSVDEPLKVNKKASSSIKLFPNPIIKDGYLTIETAFDVEDITIYNMLGGKVKQVAFNQLSCEGQSCRLDLSDLNNGVYMVEVKGSSEVVSEKILINK